LKRTTTALALAVCLASTGAVFAFQRETTNDPVCIEAPGVNCTHLGKPFFWRTFPVQYFINADASGLSLSTVRAPIDAAFSSWQSTSLDGITFQFAGQSHNGSNGQDGQNTISWQSLTNASDTLAQSILTFDSNSGEILDVDIEMNNNFQFAVLPSGENDPGDPTVDIQAVMSHEVGHLLGLAHENRFGPQVVMFFEDTSGDTTHRSLTSDDQSGVRAIYPTGSSSASNTNAGSNGGGGGGGCSATSTHGRMDILPVAVALAWLSLRKRRGSHGW
jgi:hypothetical protein